MPVATPCTAYGFQVIAGSLAPLGPRPVAWPSPPACNIDSNNGLKYDPVSGKMWVSPDVQTSHVSAQGTPYQMTPALPGTKNIDSISIQHASRICTGSFYMVQVAQGYATWLLSPGNSWTLTRDVAIYLNGTAVGFDAGAKIGSLGNGTGNSGNMGLGIPVESMVLCGELNSGDVLKVVLSYNVNLDNFVTGTGSYFHWIPPTVQSTMWSHS